MRDASQTTLETNAKYNYIRDVLQENSGDGINLMRNADTFQLPPFEEANRPTSVEGTILEQGPPEMSDDGEVVEAEE